MNDDYIITHEHDIENPDRRITYTVEIFGNNVFTTVTSKASVVRKWVNKVRHDHRFRRNVLVVGLGVQWRPPASNPVATLQLCVGRQCLIFQILDAFIPQALKKFLTDPCITFVGVRNESDSRYLMRDYNLTVNRIVELGSLSNRRGASMETLAREIIGFHGIEKPEWIGRSNWEDEMLTEEQVQYACVDAFVSFEIGKKLRAWKWNA